MGWKDVPVTNFICYCKKVTKKEIIVAINAGARTLDDIRAATGACTGDKCSVTNPTGRCCGDDIQSMLDYYGPLSDAFKQQD